MSRLYGKIGQGNQCLLGLIFFVKTDSIFYQIFLRFPSSFFELIGQPFQRTESYEFTSREVKQLYEFALMGYFCPLLKKLSNLYI